MEKESESKFVENRPLNDVVAELVHLETVGFKHKGKHFTVSVWEAINMQLDIMLTNRY